MNYQKIYNKIIENRLANPLRNDEYGEKHHILPRSLFPDKEKDKNNIVKLTYRQHYICHWLLTKIYNCKQMFQAFWRMNCCQNDIYFNSYAYSVLRNKYSNWKSISQLGVNNHAFGKTWVNNGVREMYVDGDIPEGFVKGRLPQTEQTKEKLRKSSTGRKHTPEQIAKMKKSMKGKNKGKLTNSVWINDEKVCKRVKQQQLNNYLEKGFKKGRLF